MIIHVVQPGDTIYTIAAAYNVSVYRLVEDNGLTNAEQLVIGQTIVIATASRYYVVQEDDTLNSIASAFGVTRMQLLRNNPSLSNRESIYQGEEIVISYDTQGTVAINAYAYPFIDKDILRKTLPFLTFLTIFNYRVIATGEIIGNDETEVIQIAKEYSVAPLMSLSTVNYQGISDIGVLNSVLYDEEILQQHIDNILRVLNEKSYYGLNISIVDLTHENLEAHERFLLRLSTRLKEEGFILIITISPRIVVSSNSVALETLDYTAFGLMADYLMILSYAWGAFVGPPSPPSPAYLSRLLIENALKTIPAEKIYTGISVIGYDWQSPYVLGITKANSLTTDAAIELAVQTGSIILFEENSKAAFFEYYTPVMGVQMEHIVWFSDARTIDALIKIVPEYGIQGAGIWNIMHYFAQMWLVINSQYGIIKVYIET
ncbi:MAG: Peptidoglycan-binding lysin domain protein [Anaerocolumna sp.]|jgi:spore germination protein|nr:Peptidoglycan-binding lysin domain protein [Anaerocolumna sp.]